MIISFKHVIIICFYFNVIYSKRVLRDDNEDDGSDAMTGNGASDEPSQPTSGAEDQLHEKEALDEDAEDAADDEENENENKNENKSLVVDGETLSEYVDNLLSRILLELETEKPDDKEKPEVFSVLLPVLGKISEHLSDEQNADKIVSLAQLQAKPLGAKDMTWFQRLEILFRKFNKEVNLNINTADNKETKKLKLLFKEFKRQALQSIRAIIKHSEDKALDVETKKRKYVEELGVHCGVIKNVIRGVVQTPAFIVGNTMHVIKTVISNLFPRKLRQEEIWNEGRNLVNYLVEDTEGEGLAWCNATRKPKYQNVAPNRTVLNIESTGTPVNTMILRALKKILIMAITQAVTPALTPLKLKNVIQNPVSEQGNPTIEYYVDPSSYDSIIKSRVEAAINKIEQASCLRFESIPSEGSRDSERNLIIISNPSRMRECSHFRLEPSVNNLTVHITLGYDCLQDRDILHTLMHGLGFDDEVAHPERQKYIRIMWDDLNPSATKLFQVHHNPYFIDNPVEYDPLSIMQFHDRAFSRTGRPTIVPLIPGMRISPSDDLSALDKLKLRIAFGQACTMKKLSHVMDSCRMVLTGEKPENKVDDGEIENDDGNVDGDDSDKAKEETETMKD